MKNAIICLLAFLMIGVLHGAEGLLRSAGHFNAGSNSWLDIKKKENLVSFDFYVIDVSGRKSGVSAEYDGSKDCFAYIENSEMVWFYGGGEKLVGCKVGFSNESNSYVFEKSVLNVKTDLEQMPIIIKAHFIQTKEGKR